MAIKTKRPPMKETVGAQYLCFNTMDTDGRWTSTFAEEVEKTEVVKSVKVTENGEASDTYAFFSQNISYCSQKKTGHEWKNSSSVIPISLASTIYSAQFISS